MLSSDPDNIRIANASAIKAAMGIRAMTNALPDQPAFEALRAEGLGASVGINLAPLYVGRFGPKDLPRRTPRATPLPSSTPKKP